MRQDLRSLCDQRCVDIRDRKSVVRQQCRDAPNEDAAVDAVEFGAGIGEQFTYVAESGGPQQGITQGMKQNITIRMGGKTLIKWERHTAYYDVVSVDEAMRVVTLADSHGLLSSLRPQVQFGKRQVFGIRDLDVVRVTFDHAGNTAREFYCLRFVGNKHIGRQCLFDSLAQIG